MKEYKMLFHLLVTCLLTMTEAQTPTPDPLMPDLAHKETTPHAQYHTESKTSVFPVTKTPRPVLSAALNSRQTTSSTHLRSTSPGMKNDTHKMQIERQITTEEPTSIHTEQVTTKSVNTDFGTQSPTMQLPTTVLHKTTNPPTLRQVVPTTKSSGTTEINTEKPPTKSVTAKSATSSGSNAIANAKNVVTNPATTTQEAKVLTTAKMSTEKMTMKPDGTDKTTTSSQNVVTQKTTTPLVPTAKLSATTETTLSATTQATTKVQKPTTKLAKTDYPPVITKLRTTTPTVYDEDYRKKSVKHGKIVAGIIGTALLLMMVGFLVILYKKHKLKKHQIATTDWAGPTPFLETGSENNGHVTLRSANRISLTSFLPQRLSKRLSLLAESGEEMQEMTTSSTFAGKVEKKVEENGPKANKTEKAQMNKPEKLEVDKTEKSEISTKTDDVVVVNETDKNGEIKNNDGQTENAKTEKEEDKASENTPAEPATPENPPTDTNNENKEETGKDGM